MEADLLRSLHDRRRAARPVALVTRLADGLQCLVEPAAVEGALSLQAAELENVRYRMRTDCSGEAGEGLFARVYNPPLRLVLVGAVHIAQALAPMAQCAGFRVAIVDPRTAFATAARFPGIDLYHDWPDVALGRIGIDARTAVVTLTHDPKLDDPALLAAVRSEALYIGALGSRRTQAARLQRLRDAGVGEALLARIHAPVGLPLGGRRPPEIAVAILAEIIKVIHAGSPQ